MAHFGETNTAFVWKITAAINFRYEESAEVYLLLTNISTPSLNV